MIYKETLLSNGKMLILKEAEPHEAEKMINYLNVVGGESDNLLFGEGEFRFSVEQEARIITNNLNNLNNIMLIGLIDDEMVTMSQLMTKNRARIAHNADVSISVRKAYWNCGIGSSVMKTLITFANEHPLIRVVSLSVKDGNESAIHLYKKHGFEVVGRHKDYVYLNDAYHDVLLMDLYLQK